MRHKAATQHLGRSPNARKALIRALVNSLVEHGRITTTVAKAKELRRHVERAITLAKKGSLGARRVLLSRFPNKATVEGLISDVAPRFQTRPGGYTRVLKLGNRKGDCAEMAIIEFVDYQLPTEGDAKTTKGAKKAPKAKKAKSTEAKESSSKESKAQKKTAKAGKE